MFFPGALQERLKDLEESLKSGDVYNERILELPKRKVSPEIQQTGALGTYNKAPATTLFGASGP